MPLQLRVAPALDNGSANLGLTSSRRVAIPAGEYPVPLWVRTDDGLLLRVDELPWQGVIPVSELEVLSAEPVDINKPDIHFRPDEDDLPDVFNNVSADTNIYVHRRPGELQTIININEEELVAPADGIILQAGRAYRNPATGELIPPVVIRGTGARIFDLTNRSGITLMNLGIEGGRYSGGDQTTGRGVHRGSDLYMYRCLVRDNDNLGMGGWSGELDECELAENAGQKVSGISGGSKTTLLHILRNCLVWKNKHHALWSDCDCPGMTLIGGWVVQNEATGIFWEISQGLCSINGTVITGNNSLNTAGRGGMIVICSRNVALEDVTFGVNGIQTLLFFEDGRQDQGSNGCTSGYRIGEATLTNVDFSTGTAPRHRFAGAGSSTAITANGTVNNPGSPGDTIALSGCTFPA